MTQARYDPRNWKSCEQINAHIDVNHHYRVVASRKTDGQHRAVLVNDVQKTVHTLPASGRRFTKKWYLDLLQQLVEGRQPEQTRESQFYGLCAYRPYAR